MQEATLGLGQPDQLEDSIKQNTIYNRLSPCHCSTSRGRTWVKQQQKLFCTFALVQPFYTFTICIWGGRWPNWSILPPDAGTKLAAWCWREWCWLSMCNMVKSEYHFAVTSAKRVAVLQANSKLVSEEARPQLPNEDNECSTFHGSNC